MNSLLSPSHIPQAAGTHIRPDILCGITITDSRLDDELSVATVEFSDTPQWLQTVSLDPRGFPKYTEFGTLWRDVNRADTDDAGRTAFINAVINGSRTGSMGLLYAEMLAEFLDTDVNVQDNRGRTALHWASDAGQPDLVRLCLSVPDCVIGLKDNDGLTAFDISLRSGADDTIPALFYSSMFELEQRDPQAALLRVLTVTSVPAPDMPVFPGEAIFDPIEHTNLPLVQALLDRGIDLAVRNRDGDTALHVAARLGDVHVAGMLLDHGVDVDAEDSRGRTALQVAHEQHVEDMIGLLEAVAMDGELAQSRTVVEAHEVPDQLVARTDSLNGNRSIVTWSLSSELAKSCGVLQTGGAVDLQDQRLKAIISQIEGLRTVGNQWHPWEQFITSITEIWGFQKVGQTISKSDEYVTHGNPQSYDKSKWKYTDREKVPSSSVLLRCPGVLLTIC